MSKPKHVEVTLTKSFFVTISELILLILLLPLLIVMTLYVWTADFFWHKVWRGQ